MTIKEWKTCRIKYNDCECCFEYTDAKGDLMEHKCLCCRNKKYQKKFLENLKHRFSNT